MTPTDKNTNTRTPFKPFNRLITVFIFSLITAGSLGSAAHAQNGSENQPAKRPNTNTPDVHCEQIEVTRKGFTLNIYNRDPQGWITHYNDSMHAVFFFTEVANAQGQTLVHQWLYNGQPAAEVTLKVGTNSWRTWSSKVLGLRRAHLWSVKLSTLSGCKLGVYQLSAEPSAPQPTTPVKLDHARALLQQGDWAGAKLEATALQQDANTGAAGQRQIQHFIDTEIELARITRDLEQGQLYTASSRLQRLKENTLSASMSNKVADTEQQLHTLLKRRNSETAKFIQSIENTLLHSLNGGNACPDTLKQALKLLPQEELAKQALQITDIEIQQNQQRRLLLLDRKTGKLHAIELSCLPNITASPNDSAVNQPQGSLPK